MFRTLISSLQISSIRSTLSCSHVYPLAFLLFVPPFSLRLARFTDRQRVFWHKTGSSDNNLDPIFVFLVKFYGRMLLESPLAPDFAEMCVFASKPYFFDTEKLHLRCASSATVCAHRPSVLTLFSGFPRKSELDCPSQLRLPQILRKHDFSLFLLFFSH